MQSIAHKKQLIALHAQEPTESAQLKNIKKQNY